MNNKNGLELIMIFLKKTVKNILYALNYVSWLYRYLKLRLGFSGLRDIKIVSIEFASICNLRCRYCFLEQKDRARFLDIEIYEKLIKEIAENLKYKIRAMEWPIGGEFFVYPQYRQVVEITKKYWDANPHFRPRIILNENLMLLDEEKIDLILNSGIVSQIICSIDGHDAETFEGMRPPAKFDKLKENFNILIRKNEELENPVFIQINNGRDEGSMGEPLSQEMADIFEQGNDVTFWQPKSWNESFNEGAKQFNPAKGFCTFVFNNVTLSSSGHILKCCMDLKGSTMYADFSKNTLEEIWHTTARKQFLGLMLKNRRKLIQGCNTCSITSTNNDNRSNSITRSFKRIVLPVKCLRYQTGIRKMHN